MLPEVRQDKPTFDEITRMVSDAGALEQEGKSVSAFLLLSKARDRLLETVQTSRTTKAAFSWQLALIFVSMLLSGVVYYWQHNHKRTKALLAEAGETKVLHMRYAQDLAGQHPSGRIRHPFKE